MVDRLKANKPDFDGVFINTGSAGNTVMNSKILKAGDNGLEVEAGDTEFKTSNLP